jgi:hypothetical protein
MAAPFLLVQTYSELISPSQWQEFFVDNRDIKEMKRDLERSLSRITEKSNGKKFETLVPAIVQFVFFLILALGIGMYYDVLSVYF